MAITRGTVRSAGQAFTPDEMKAYNDMIRKWTSKVRLRIKSSSARFANGGSGKYVKALTPSIGSGTKMDYGIIDRVNIKFERHGVFVHKGVGRGYVMRSGNVIRVAYTPATPATKRRKPVDWFNAIIENNLPELANSVATFNADAVINEKRMFIR